MSGPKSFNQLKPLLSVVGLTATGKTGLSLWLAEQLLAENRVEGVALISADSRQVYRGLETLTGADVPGKFNRQKNEKLPYSYFKHKQQPITLHGVSIIYPTEDWSVAHFRDMAIEIIQHSWSQNRLPIVVGGTGLYHQQLFNNDPDIYVKPNPEIRNKAENKSVEELQTWLKEIDSKHWENMNRSDRHNPRRLIRAIEISQALKTPGLRINSRPKFQKPNNYYQIGLKTNFKNLEAKIKKRVLKRFTQGAIAEVKNLLKLSLDAKHPAMTATGVKPIQKYLQKKLTKQETIEAWTRQELQYAKRQLTWWKKHGSVEWYQPNQQNYKQQIKHQIIEQLSL